MVSVMSTTFDDKYLWYLPLVTWGWNRIGVDVICFMPLPKNQKETEKWILAVEESTKHSHSFKVHYFNAPEHKEATYAQCSRLYAASLDLPQDEVLIVSDVDMLVFNLPPEVTNPNGMTIFGTDLVPDGQYPMCYLSGTVNDWRNVIGEGTYQEHLDNLLGGIEAEHFRGNYWGKDQETAYQLISKVNHTKINRARPQTQWASKRYDRDDAYLLDRLSLDTIDYHLNRPGYEENNFQTIMKVLKYHYPLDDFGWLEEYRKKYMELL